MAMHRLTYVALGCRLLLGFVWLIAAAFKAIDFGGFNEIMRLQYELPRLLSYPAAFLPALETFLGLCLILEFRVRQALWASIALLGGFCLVIVYGLSVGELESCGCLGSFDDIAPHWAIARNMVLGILAYGSLRFDPQEQEASFWKGWVIAAACIVCALGTGSSIHQPHFQEPSLVSGQALPELEIDIPELNKGPVAIYLFKAGCSKCWDAMAQVQTLSAEPRLKIVGMTPSLPAEIQTFRSAFKPEFPIYSISDAVYKKIGSKIPAIFMIYDGILQAHVEQRVPTLTSIRHFSNDWFESFLEAKATP